MAQVDVGTQWQKIISAGSNQRTYFLEVEGGAVVIGRSPTADRRAKTELRDEDRGQITLPPGEDLFAQANSGTVTITVNLLSFDLELYPRENVIANTTISTINDQLPGIDGTSQISQETTSAGTDISLDLGDLRNKVDVYWDGSGTGTLTVEVSDDNNTWRQLDTISTDSTQNVEQYNVAYQYVRASVNQNLNTLELVSRGLI